MLSALLFHALAKAQDTTAIAHIPLPPLMLKWSLLSLAELTPYIQFAIEHQLNKKTYVNIELGVSPTAGSYYNNYNDFIGFRLRGDLRWYRQKNNSNKKFNFVAIELMTKYETWTQNEQVERAGGAYREWMQIDYDKFFYGANVLLGRKFLFKNSPLFIELLSGVGFKVKYINKTKLPTDAAYIANNNTIADIFMSNPGNYPNLVISMKIGVCLK